MTKRIAPFMPLLAAVLSWGRSAEAQPTTATAWLSVSVPEDDAVLLVDGEAVAPVHGRVAVTPGQHTVSAELRDGRFFDAIVDVAAGARRRVRLGPAPVLEEESPRLERGVELVPPSRARGRLPDRYPHRALSPVWRLVGLGATTLLATCLVVFALETQQLSDQYQRDPTRQHYDEGMQYKSFTQFGLFPATLVSAGLTALAFVLSTPQAE